MPGTRISHCDMQLHFALLLATRALTCQIKGTEAYETVRFTESRIVYIALVFLVTLYFGVSFQQRDGWNKFFFCLMHYEPKFALMLYIMYTAEGFRAVARRWETKA